VALNQNFEIWDEAALFKLWHSDHSDFVNALHDIWHLEIRFVVLDPVRDKVLEVKDVAHLTGNCYAHAIACSHFAIKLNSILRSFNKLAID
jgi:hypothetical protein